MTAPATLDQISADVQSYAAGQVAVVQAQVGALTLQLSTAQNALTAEQAADAGLLAQITALKAQIGALSAQVAQAAPDGRPAGAGYVRWEDLYSSAAADTLRTVLGKSQAAGKVLTMPAGDFRLADFAQGTGVYSLPNGPLGVVGSVDANGKPITQLGILPGTSTKGKTVAALASGSTNPYYLLDAITGANYTEFGNLLFSGNAGHLHGGMRVRNDNGTAHLYNVELANAAPGSGHVPPVETFGVDLWHILAALLENVQADGGGAAGSLLGFNNVGKSVVKDSTLANGKNGHGATWWLCGDVETDNVISKGNLVEFNHENVSGKTLHNSPTLQPDRSAVSTECHMTYRNATYPDNPNIEIHDPVVDKGMKNGCLTIATEVAYVDALKAKQRQTSLAKVYSGATLLKACDAGGNPLPPATAHVPASSDAPDPAKNWWRYR